MKLFLDKFFYKTLLLFSRLPLKVLYYFSDFIYFILYYIIGYRKKTIIENLVNAFPNKDYNELLTIRKEFYKNFCDFMVETLKAFTISQNELEERFPFENIEVFDEIRAEGKDVIMLSAHSFNWEWYIGFVKYLGGDKTYAVYRRIRSQFWNEKINAMRGRFGTVPLLLDDTAKTMLRNHTDKNISNTYLFISDQSPYVSDIHHSLEFLNQETPVFIGYDKIAIKKDIGIVYCETKKIKRGHYKTVFSRLLPEGDKWQPLEITNQFFNKLEKQIHEQPSNWLWSHKRWKYKKGIDY